MSYDEIDDFLTEYVDTYAHATETQPDVDTKNPSELKELHPLTEHGIASSQRMRKVIFTVVLVVSVLGIIAPTLFMGYILITKEHIELLTPEVIIAYFTSVCSQSILLLIALTRSLFSAKFYDTLLALGK